VFGEEIEGRTIGEADKVPVYVQLYDDGSALNAFAAMLDDGDEEHKRVGQVKEIAAAWPYKESMQIRRNSDGTIQYLHGTMVDMFKVYMRVNPGINLSALFEKYTRGIDEPVSPYRSTAVVAQELFNEVLPSDADAALFFNQSIKQLKVLKRK
jgi:hypothetical protein